MNLVYEPMDRIMVLEQVSSILEDHPPFMGRKNCNCEICQRAAEAGRVARYSPKVARILAKGEDMTTSEYEYLIERGLTQEEIQTETGVVLARFDQPSNPLTLQGYERLKEQGARDIEIARMYGMTESTFYKWKRMNGIIKVVVKGLDKETYAELKSAGFSDRKIALKFGTRKDNIHCWKHQNFTVEEIKAMNQTPGRRKKA